MNQEIKDNLSLNKEAKTVIYLDVNNMFFRAYHSAEVTNGNPIHYFLNMVYSLRMSIEHSFAFAIFDGENSRKSRTDIYPEYKANREKLKDKNGDEVDLNKMFKMCEEILENLGFNIYSSNGIESDDVIGILARKSINKGLNVIAVSSDKDYKQLCQYSPYINIYNTQHKIITNQKNFIEKNELEPISYVDYLALVGDSSDGIKGVNKVGDKTAKKWLNEFKTINGIKNNLNKIKDGVVKNNLIEALNNGIIDRNIKLISFHFDKEELININKKSIFKSQVNIEKLDEFCIRHNMRQFREKYIDPLIDLKQYTRKPELYEILNNKISNKKNEQKKTKINNYESPF